MTTATRPPATGETTAVAVPTPAPQPPPDANSAHPLKLRLPAAVIAAGPDAREQWFWAVCDANTDSLWQMELTAAGVLELMPSYAYAERREFRTGFALESWNIAHGEPGMTTGPSAAYRLPNGAIRGPDAAWTRHANIAPPRTDPPRTWPFCPDFVIEIASTTPALPELLAKMREYMENGARLAWLLDPLERTVRIYRPAAPEPELLHNPQTLHGEDVLPGFAFPVRQLIFDLQ